MKITLLELRRIIRETISECYGWPVESEKPLYNVKSVMGKPSKHDPKNSPLRQRGSLKESFSKITSRELDEWRSGNWGYLSEAAGCEKCGGDMDKKGKCTKCKRPSAKSSISDQKECNACNMRMSECNC
jgi:hypothetical protein